MTAGVEDGRHAALVLAEHGQHLARERDQRAGHLLGEDRRRRAARARGWRSCAAARRRSEPMPCASDRSAPPRARPPRPAAASSRAVGPDAAAHLEDVLGRHRALRLHPGEQAGAARHVLAADLEHVLEAGRGDERGAARPCPRGSGWWQPSCRAARGRCRRRSSPAIFSTSAMPLPKPREGSSGVDGVLAVQTRPVAGSSSVTSVNVPPVSMPTMTRGLGDMRNGHHASASW